VLKITYIIAIMPDFAILMRFLVSLLSVDATQRVAVEGDGRGLVDGGGISSLRR